MQLPRESFDRLVENAIASLPREFARWIERVPIIVEDVPPKNSNMVGFYQGISLPDREFDSGQLPPRIVLFRQPLMDACRSRGRLAEEIRKTLLHELGHYVGMNEEQLDRLGYGPLEGDDGREWDKEDEGERG